MSFSWGESFITDSRYVRHIDRDIPRAATIQKVEAIEDSLSAFAFKRWHGIVSDVGDMDLRGQIVMEGLAHIGLRDEVRNPFSGRLITEGDIVPPPYRGIAGRTDTFYTDNPFFASLNEDFLDEDF